jgi:hypothetical protein
MHVIAIVLVPGAIGYFSENAANLNNAASVNETPDDAAEQRDTFVPQPNHLPLFTRGSGTR